jgi:protein TonB
MKIGESVQTLGTVLLLALTLYGCATDNPTASTTPPPPPSVVRTPLRLDPAYPPRLGDAYYPPESKRLSEQGRCLLNVTVQADGSTRDVSLVQSSGYPRLDEACLHALFPGKFIPATENGKPVEITVQIPIDWSLH